MKRPEWLKSALVGAVAGAVAMAIVGFYWGGWQTGGAARKMAAAQAQEQVVAALAPICVEQSKLDPEAADKIATMKDAPKYQRTDLLMKTGWATMPGSSGPDRIVAGACAESLSTQF